MALTAVVQFISHAAKIERGMGGYLDTAVQKSLAVIERNIKANTPVKEGHLRRSIQRRMTGTAQGEVYSGTHAGAQEIDYAVHVEYGTRHMAPRAMFRKGVTASEPKVRQIMGDALKRLHDGGKIEP